MIAAAPKPQPTAKPTTSPGEVKPSGARKMTPKYSIVVSNELFHNGKLVSGPDATYYTLSQAQKNCQFNVDNNRSKSIKVECRYNGKQFYP